MNRELCHTQETRRSDPYGFLANWYDEYLGRVSFLRARRALEWALRQLRIRPRSAADLGCGTGLFVRYLRGLGCSPVYGIDRSVAMLEQARRANGYSGVRLLCQDIRRLRLPTPVDLVTAHADVINHLLDASDIIGVFESVRSQLRFPGCFIFDVVTHDHPPPIRWRYIHRFPKRAATLVEDAMWDPGTHLLRIVCRIAGPTQTVPHVTTHHERTYCMSEVCCALERARFSSIDVRPASMLLSLHEPWCRQVVFARP